MKIFYIIPVILILVIPACTSSKKVISWKKENSTPQNYSKILVLGFMRVADNSIRENIEGQLSEYLRKEGINAVSSLELYGTKVFDRMDEEDALYQLNNSCVDAVLTVTLLNKKKEKNYLPGNINYTPYAYYNDRFWRYRTTINYRLNEPGYYEDATDVFIEGNLYDMATQKLVYSIHTKPSAISGFESMDQEYEKAIVKDLVKKGVLKTLKYQ